MSGHDDSQAQRAWEDRGTELAAELERLVAWSALVLEATEGTAREGDLLEDLEERLVRVASRLRGRQVLPHTFHHPMPREAGR